jgi:radical SAM superfamily enzyme
MQLYFSKQAYLVYIMAIWKFKSQIVKMILNHLIIDLIDESNELWLKNLMCLWKYLVKGCKIDS